MIQVRILTAELFPRGVIGSTLDSGSGSFGFESWRGSMGNTEYTPNKKGEGRNYARVAETAARYYRRRRAAVFEALGGVCSTCGTNEDLLICSKDHVNPARKGLSRVNGNPTRLDEVKILCKSCRKNERNEQMLHGRVRYRLSKCRCDVCVRDRQLEIDERKEYSRKYRSDGRAKSRAKKKSS